MLGVVLISFPVSINADQEGGVTIGLTDYLRVETWSYDCVDFSTSFSFTKYLAGLFGLFTYSNDGQTSNPNCSGSGGLGKSTTYVHWGYYGGSVMDIQTTAPRYGSKTCVIRAVYDKSSDSNFSNKAKLRSVSDYCSNRVYTWDTCDRDNPQCIAVLLHYNNFDNFVKEIGNGYTQKSFNYDGMLQRNVSFRLRSKLGLKMEGLNDNIVYTVKLKAVASELLNYPYGDAVHRPLGWGEYTVAGKQVSKGGLFKQPYTLQLDIKGGESLDITPLANLPLYTFNVSLLSFSAK